MSFVFLKVDFKDKDRAKALGARWDPVQKKWYAPGNISLELFAEWLPKDFNLLPSSPKIDLVCPEANIDAEKSISLSQLLARVSQAVHEAIPKAEWIRAEVSECHAKSGHFYLDLVEFDANHQLLCKAKSIIFKGRLPALLAKFQATTVSFLEAGMKALLQVKANFSIQYGFSLNVEDIDPHYTLGDMAAKLAKIRERLQQEGIYLQNKQLAQPQDFTRVAVISPKGAAGLGDFQQGTVQLERLHLCTFHYYSAQFQGTEASLEIATAIEAVTEDNQKLSFDALVIIRGGGAVIDLAWLNDYALAKLICQSPLVVFTGIGHERDNTILDEVASLRFDTPSKVIAYIFSRITDNAQTALNHAAEIQAVSHRLELQMQHSIFEQFTTLIHSAERAVQQTHQIVEQWHGQLYQVESGLQLMETRLKHWFEGLEESSLISLHYLNTALQQYWQEIQKRAPECLIEFEQSIERYWQQFNLNVDEGQVIIQERLQKLISDLQSSFKSSLQIEDSLRELMSNIIGLGPTGTLKRGYALVRNAENKMMTSKVDSETQSHLEIEFHDGCLNVKPI